MTQLIKEENIKDDILTKSKESILFFKECNLNNEVDRNMYLDQIGRFPMTSY
jgi:hypothetical protein